MIAPASTTDAIPPITEPTKTTGISKANEDRYNSFPALRTEKRSSLLSKLYFTAKKWLISIITTPISKPGIIPAANNDAIEISVALARTIIIILGGIIPPMVELTPVTAAEKAGGYPAFFIAGNTNAPNCSCIRYN